jgi:hypothetical protein
MMRPLIGSSGRFRVRTLAAVALGSSFAAIRTGQAAIIYSGTIDQVLSLQSPGQVYSINFPSTGSAEVSFIGPTVTQSKDGVEYLGIDDWQNGFMPVGKQEKSSSAYEADALPAGLAINSVDGFVSAATQADLFESTETLQGAWSAGLDAYLGFEFTLPADGQTHYGWVQVAISSDGTEATIENWAWDNTPNESINAGQVPEPATGALLAVCLGGAFLRRRR